MEVNKTRYWQMYTHLILIFESDLIHANISYGLTCECKYVYLMIFVGMQFLGCFGVGGIGLLSATMQLRNRLCRRFGELAYLPVSGFSRNAVWWPLIVNFAFMLQFRDSLLHNNYNLTKQSCRVKEF